MPTRIEALTRRVDEAIARRSPPAAPIILWGGNRGEDSAPLLAQHIAEHPEDVDRPCHLVFWLGLPDPDKCSRESVSEWLPKAKAQMAKESSGTAPADLEQTSEAERHWRDLCARFGVDYDNEPA
jgi:hypothetical protein